MDWLKKYYEKVLLAAALLLLIGVAAGLVFKINSLSAEFQASIHPELPNKPVAPIELTTYSNALSTLTTPPLWTNANAARLFPPVLVKPSTVPTQSVEVVTPPRPVIVLERIVRQPFKLYFLAYLVDDAAKGTGRGFQVNFLTWNRSFFVERVGAEIADRHGKTGYFITKFERKTELVEVPGIGKREKDRSELTVKHEGEDPITLTLGEVAVYPKRYARIRTPSRTADFGKGESFECADKTYKVFDITDKTVVIEDLKSGEKQTLQLDTGGAIRIEP